MLVSACGATSASRGLAPPDREPTRTFPKDPADFGDADFLGEAVWYGPGLHGNRTANGERFDMNAFTAAHRRLPFNTVVRVTRIDTGASVDVRINDRGPGSTSRVIDLARAAARAIDMIEIGHAPVRIDVIAWGDGAIYER